MIHNRQLELLFTGALRARYKRTDQDISPNSNSGDIEYNDLKFNFKNGSGRERVDLFHSKRYSLNNSVLILDLDGGIQNIWGDLLDFDSIKHIEIRNRSAFTGAFLEVRFKNERYYIGPEGYRIITEPWGTGIESIVSSSSSEEGGLVFASDTNIEFDLIIAGSSQEQSSSSSGL